MLRQCWHSHVWGLDSAYNLAVRGNWVEVDKGQLPYNDGWVSSTSTTVKMFYPFLGWKDWEGPSNEYIGRKIDCTLWGWKGTCTNNTLMSFLGSIDTPVQIPGKYIDYYVGGSETAKIINEDGDLFSWGCNGTTGNGTITTLSPVQIAGKWKGVVRGASGAIRQDNTLWLWNNACSTQNYLHWGTLSCGSPIKIPGGWCCAQAPSARVMFGIKANCSLFTWGHFDNYGILGNGLYNSCQDSPVQVPGCWICVVAYGNAIYGIKHDCTMWGWGYNTGLDGTSKSSPTQIPGKWIEFSRINGSLAVIAKQDDNNWYGWRRSGNMFGLPCFSIPGKACGDYFYCPTLLNPQFDNYYTTGQRTYFLTK